ncbi:GNAT family N-acetyltransferase [Pedomonas mirosovicensis]|uniref:GNAT family N-acetyltransferase n=1 Tax=Pedomonas mirosovicensis TaxID=2908641 RepID=UPI002167216E|nr:GNAT family N-acetyltransferase [Pedomonas mirosovicensis]
MSTVVIETPRLALREWRGEDRAPFAAMNADPEVMRYFPRPYTPEESNAMVDRIMAMMAERGFGFYAVEEKGGAPFIGFVGLSVPRFEAAFTPCVEIGWRLMRSAWGAGLRHRGGPRRARRCLHPAGAGGDRLLHRRAERALPAGDAAHRFPA